MEIVYGPVPSWRLGKSLGVDLICSKHKICTFECTYCQLLQTEKHTNKRQNFVDLSNLEKELKLALKKSNPDVITLSGTGEPTLALNIDEAVQIIRKNTKKPIAILTNSSLLHLKKVRDSLKKIDIIVTKLDAVDKESFNEINQPTKEITFKQTFKSIKKMRKEFKGFFSIQTMYLKKNKDYVDQLIKITKDIDPDEVQINTPLRPCKEQPLSKMEIEKIEKKYKNLNAISVYSSNKPKIDPIDKLKMIQRRGSNE